MSKRPAPRKMPGGKVGGGKGGGGSGGGGSPAPAWGKSPWPGRQPKQHAKQHHKHAHQKHHHTGGWGGLKNMKIPAGKAPKAGKHPKRGLAGPSLAGWWITGGNDVADNCAAVAVANSLLAATGRRIPDTELLRLHDRAGPLSIPEALAAFSENRTYSRSCWQVQDGVGNGLKIYPPVPTVLGLATPHGPHAALWASGGLVTWGGLIEWPDDWLADEAWEVTWPS